MTIRYVQKSRFPVRDGDPGECQLCGTRWGVVAPNNACDSTICLMCGSRQCMVNGLGHGACSICYTGLLLGWSNGGRRKCGYRNCENVAVSSAPRVGFACRQHLKDPPDEMIRNRRMTQFVPTDDDGYKFSSYWDSFDFDTVHLIR